MKYIFFIVIGVAVVLGGAIFFINQAHPTQEFAAGSAAQNTPSATPSVSEKPLEVRIQEAQEKSSHIKGIYMTAEVASDGGSAATRLRNSIIHIAEQTEINGIVIDVKEVCGPEYNTERLKKLISELHAKHIWAIARIVTFKDASQIETHPEWYVKRAVFKAVSDQCANKTYLRAKNPDGKKSGETVFWRDNKGGYWLDPASVGAREYIVEFGKKIIDLGFDELQFDYIRFLSDGDVAKAQFPVWNGKTPKFMVLKSFFEMLHDSLKSYKPEIILSADMFGYAAIREGDVGIGQRLEDIGNSFDYVSFMVYPSHYYSGLYLPADPAHHLPAINYDRREVRVHPDVTVGRSLRVAQDFLDGLMASSTATTTIGTVIGADAPKEVRHVKLRPWLEDFFHDADRVAHRPYGAQKVLLEIQGAESVSNGGWLLWNASNIYTQEALKPKGVK